MTAEAQRTYADYGTRSWRRDNAQRTLTFFFAGNLNLADTSGAYSEGVRRQLWLHHSNTSGFRIVPNSASYRDDFRRSVFCAAPLGEGWGIRLIWAVAFGCIPVLFQSSVKQFFDDTLPYERFSLTVSLDGAPKAPSL